MKTILTPEQSKTLIDLGVPEDKASLCAWAYDDGYRKDPMFTFLDLLDLLPPKIKHEYVRNDNKEATLSMQFIDNGWSCQYNGLVWKGAISYREELIDALYELLMWVVKNV